MADSAMEDLITLLAIPLLICWALWHFDVALFSDTKTLYAEVRGCNEEFTIQNPGIERCKWQTALLRKFKVDVENQVVLELVTANGTLERLENCVVYDRNNWHCLSNIPIGSTQGFTQGHFISPSPEYLRELNKTYWVFNWWIN